jgi:hypothetical protein
MAKASARPITMQLVMIRPTKTESVFEISKAKAFRNWSTTITSEAMITICTMMRIELGMWLRSIEMNIDEKAVTKITASAITVATCSEEVTASAEQMPST